MNAEMRRLFPKWLRDRAAKLRRAAVECDRAYTHPELTRACNRVAAAYRRAANLLVEEAEDLEVTLDHAEATRG